MQQSRLLDAFVSDVAAAVTELDAAVALLRRICLGRSRRSRTVGCSRCAVRCIEFQMLAAAVAELDAAVALLDAFCCPRLQLY